MAYNPSGFGSFNIISRQATPYPLAYTTTDTLAFVSTSGYFNALVQGQPSSSVPQEVYQGDFIFVKCSDYSATLAITSATGAIPVTTTILNSSAANPDSLPERNTFIGSSGGVPVPLDLGASGNVLASNGTTLVPGTFGGDLLAATVSGTTVNMTIAPDAVTNAKMAEVPGLSFKGNPTGSLANPIDMTAAQATATLNPFVGDTGMGGLQGLVPAPNPGDGAALKVLCANGGWVINGNGTVTSVSMSVPSIFTVSGVPITSAGTIALGLANESANTVWAGPNGGPAASPTFRALVAADIPVLPYVSTSLNSAQIIVGNASNIATAVSMSQDATISNTGAVTVQGLQTVPVASTTPTTGQVLTYNGSSWAPGTGSSTGTVTSVGLALPGIFSVSGSPVTTAGTLTATFTTQNANVVFAGPATGSPATPTFRALVAADLPSISLGGDLSGTTSAATVIKIQGVAVSSTAPTTNQVLAYNGSAWAPTAASSGTVTGIAFAAPSIFTVSGSPITTAGTITLGLATETANTVWAGPSSGSAATPTFRALVANDIPSLPYAPSALTNGDIFVGNASNVATGVAPSGDVGLTNAGVFTVKALQTVSVSNTTPTTNQALIYNGSAWAPTNLPTGGTVTSVGLSLPGIFSISGSPVTTSGTLTATLTTQSANVVWAGPSSGSAAAPTFRALVANDIPALPYISTVLTSAEILVGNGSNVATAVAVSQDISLANTGAMTVVGIQTIPVSSTAPTTNQLLVYNGSEWAPTNPSGGGTVTSVALTLPGIFSVSGSPITTSGTLAATLATQTANTVWAGPTTGSAAAPTFRALVAADIPSLPYVSTSLPSAHIFVGNGSNVASGVAVSQDLSMANTGAATVVGIQTIAVSSTTPTSGQVLAYNGTQWAPSAAASGSVTSVALALPGIFTVSGSPVTTSGTLTGTLATQTANTVWAGPTTGSAAAPTFRALVAGDIPSLPYASSTLTSAHLFVGNASNVATSVAASGDVSLANTGAFTVTALQTFAVASTTPTTNQVLTYNGSAWAPATPAGSGTVTSVALSLPNIFTVSGSPVTSTGTLTGTLATQSANVVWAGPSSGSASAPTFRALVAADIPSLPYISTTLNSGQILVGNASNVATAVTVSGDINISSSGAASIQPGVVTPTELSTSIVAYQVFNNIYTTVGGSPTENITTPGILATDTVIATLRSTGVTGLVFQTAVTSTNQISLTFNLDPSYSTVINLAAFRNHP